MPLNGRYFTWANNLEDPNFEKLDKVLFCPEWEEHYPLSILQAFAWRYLTILPCFWILEIIVQLNPFSNLKMLECLEMGLESLLLKSGMIITLVLGRKSSVGTEMLMVGIGK